MSVQENIGALEAEDAPFISAPYPRSIVQVVEPDTRGERDVVDLIKDEWFAKIDELEELSDERFDGDGYSGSFIRNVLREHFAPADEVEALAEEEDAVEAEEGVDGEEPASGTQKTDSVAQQARDQASTTAEAAEEEGELNTSEEGETSSIDLSKKITRERVRREGMKAALVSDITKEEALEAYQEGFEEGEILAEEIDHL